MQSAPASPRFPTSETIVPDTPVRPDTKSGPVTVMDDEGCGPPLREDDKKDIVARCVAEILRILDQRNER
ncbi:DUF5908 family protein [Gimibacter soli]|uniref:Uncharacterized protein n=1 Tax=Gimibacter soli TaxID=3024400 RepID=A0AAE9XM71_9PROT|nr:DUF5908 family protein [Gimibacter soli]WCL53453.1 hypothetical protein PH603_12980 [Gimibacter soli]